MNITIEEQKELILRNWQCPYCNEHSYIKEGLTLQRRGVKFKLEGKHLLELHHGNNQYIFKIRAIACPNVKCMELTISAKLYSSSEEYADYIANDCRITLKQNENQFPGSDYAFDMNPPKTKAEFKKNMEWQLMPEASYKNFPSTIPIPKSIIQDYQEACKILQLSPKASATLSRRCLQGMIRDFWKISKPTLCEEIQAIEKDVQITIWKAIDKVRKYGNIGAHTQKNVNEIIDITKEESSKLIWLIEFLIDNWYIRKHEEEQKLEEINTMTEKKVKI